ncbi:MAG: DNA-binding response regulator [Sphingobacteriales bacterium 50-39]|nr:response regulator transcription factor [Sphingobacteriales bacterium]OJW60167.1 MAG: DNA-binding response regulator [Sphingobacteriales bacterium 50-39]
MTNTTPIRCIIVDDEPLAVALLADYVQKTPGLEVILRTTHVLDALQAVQEDRADLLFLDIQMPELTGIQFMKIIRRHCAVILTTAYTQYALEGYEYDVVDYLLKPITLDRFMIAVEKAKQRLRRVPEKLSEASPVHVPDHPDHLFVRTEYRIQRVDLASIYYIEALRDYVAIHTGTGKILSLESMKHMEELLPEDQFIRIHKSYIIHRNKIDFLERGRVVIGKEYLPIGDTYKEKVRVKLGLL